MSIRKKLKEELDSYKGTLVLDGFKVVLLLDAVEEEDDFYWVYYHPNRRGYDTSLYLSSCVGGYTPLKGFIPDEDYDRMVKIFELNLGPISSILEGCINSNSIDKV